jgi:hypothetical protein
MQVKMILPALTEALSPFWRPIKYHLFPPLGLATIAAFFAESDQICLQDEHVEPLNLNDEPDLVVIQVYITSAALLGLVGKMYSKIQSCWRASERNHKDTKDTKERSIRCKLNLSHRT